MKNLDGYCYGPVLCDPRPDGRVDMHCVDWASPRVPCAWRRTARNRFTAAIAALWHGLTHGAA
jgi:hypothetical protein